MKCGTLIFVTFAALTEACRHLHRRQHMNFLSFEKRKKYSGWGKMVTFSDFKIFFFYFSHIYFRLTDRALLSHRLSHTASWYQLLSIKYRSYQPVALLLLKPEFVRLYHHLRKICKNTPMVLSATTGLLPYLVRDFCFNLSYWFEIVSACFVISNNTCK